MRARHILVLAAAAAVAVAFVAFAGESHPPTVPLRVVVRPGWGAVVAGPLRCESTCTWRFARRAHVSLAVEPAMGFAFGGWSTPCTGRRRCVVAAGRVRALAARLVPLPRAVSWNPHTTCKPVVTTLAAFLGTQRNARGGATEAGGAFVHHYRGTGDMNHRLDPVCALDGTPTLVEIDDLVVDDKFHQVEDDDWVGGLSDPARSDTSDAYLKRFHSELDATWVHANVAPLPPPAVGQHVDVQGFVFWDTGHLGDDWHAFSGWELHPVAAWRPAVHPR